MPHPITDAIRENITAHAEVYTDAGNALLAVLDQHQPYYHGHKLGSCCNTCTTCAGKPWPYPCPTVEVIRTELGVTVVGGFRA